MVHFALKCNKTNYACLTLRSHPMPQHKYLLLYTTIWILQSALHVGTHAGWLNKNGQFCQTYCKDQKSQHVLYIYTYIQKQNGHIAHPWNVLIEQVWTLKCLQTNYVNAPDSSTDLSKVQWGGVALLLPPDSELSAYPGHGNTIANHSNHMPAHASWTDTPLSLTGIYTIIIQIPRQSSHSRWHCPRHTDLCRHYVLSSKWLTTHHCGPTMCLMTCGVPSGLHVTQAGLSQGQWVLITSGNPLHWWDWAPSGAQRFAQGGLMWSLWTQE
jgi:hypothetical protein